jgi:hypothetical protein
VNAKRIVDTLLEAKPVPYWEREHRQRHTDALKKVRDRYGRAGDKAQPTPRQAKLIARWKQQGKDRRIIDYCDREKIDPNRVISRLKESTVRSKLEDGAVVKHPYLGRLTVKVTPLDRVPPLTRWEAYNDQGKKAVPTCYSERRLHFMLRSFSRYVPYKLELKT